ncbi:hypothetical protein [Planktothricoides raciborskii]|uniref:Uncharacterized protein n=1 Tax=Planktothricoides raciborskii FACHB-1370 TaxID=2949576 RepID=A0ABR8EA45_9CYAN|nr:hypothetical protein [Planktothricoides raciborskii]MBD2543350.1 hypothetical protein [Planktothricoides raciborskii FACHB-1370]
MPVAVVACGCWLGKGERGTGNGERGTGNGYQEEETENRGNSACSSSCL